MDTLLDSRCLQTRWHHNSGRRLTPFLELAAEICGNVPSCSLGQPLLESLLKRYQVLISLTREEPYQPDEIKDIRSFVEAGGSLLAMTNHADTPKNHRNWTRYDSALARAFNVHIHRACFSTESKPARLDAQNFSTGHPIITSGNGVQEVQFNNCAALSGEGDPIIFLSSDLSDRTDELAPEGLLFALSTTTGRGRAVFVADSGFIGADDTERGYWGQGSNAELVGNILKWLCRQV